LPGRYFPTVAEVSDPLVFAAPSVFRGPLVRLRTTGFMLTPRSMGANGSFEFNDVNPDEYELQPRAGFPTPKITKSTTT